MSRAFHSAAYDWLTPGAHAGKKAALCAWADGKRNHASRVEAATVPFQFLSGITSYIAHRAWSYLSANC